MLRCLIFGLPDVPVRVAAWALRLADRLILQAYLPLSVVGIYALGYMLGSAVFDLVASAVNSAILPFFYRTVTEAQSDSRRVFAVIAAWDAALLSGLGLATVLFAHEVIVVLATPRYLAAETIVPLVVWASLFQALAHVPSRAIYVVKKTAWLPAVFVVPAALNVGLNLLLVPRWGMLGAALATLAAYPVLFLLTLAVAQRVYPIPYDYVRMAKPLVILLVLSLAKNAAPPDPAWAVGFKAVLLAAFPVALLVSGFVTVEERRLLAGLVRSSGASRQRARATLPTPDTVDHRRPEENSHE